MCQGRKLLNVFQDVCIFPVPVALQLPIGTVAVGFNGITALSGEFPILLPLIITFLISAPYLEITITVGR